MGDDDAKLGVGLGCKGIIHILIEPITDGKTNPVDLLKAAIASEEYPVLVTVF
jgi:xanthine/CO dehydrogenase XdhC/CoxF family maturation factor